jgi:L-lactate dehydrogenase complex protein LldF
MSDNFDARAAKAMQNAQLMGNLKNSSSLFKEHREAAFATLDDPEAARDHAHEVRSDALDHLPDLLKTFEERATANGTQVHWARTGAEANQIIVDIAKRIGARVVVKGKSMVTEETELNTALEEAGAEVFETDLGEYIVQLAGEPPSHIVAPAVHKNRYEISELFSEKLGVPRTGDPEELTRQARVALREQFLNADLGVTGANMLIAETGSVMLVENEGNIRMSSTLPRVHVAVTGIEKVVADLDDAAAVLRVLPRSAAGQKLSIYTNIFTGPRHEGEVDGPEEMHVIILDNGRSRIWARPEFRQFLRCLRCGACLSACPVYERTGGHTYGSIYCGPMGVLLTSLTAERPGELPFACTGCGACAEVCPVRIDHVELFMRLRALEAGQKNTASPMTKTQARAFKALAMRPAAFRAASGALRIFSPALAAKAPGVGKKLAAWTRSRTLPKPAKKPFSKRWADLEKQLGGES